MRYSHPKHALRPTITFAKRMDIIELVIVVRQAFDEIVFAQIFQLVFFGEFFKNIVGSTGYFADN